MVLTCKVISTISSFFYRKLSPPTYWVNAKILIQGEKEIDPQSIINLNFKTSAPNGLANIKEAARQFDVVCIDSWGKIPGVKSEDFDRLRKEFPKTMFIVIFQSTTNGTARGGCAPEYDAGIVIQVAEGGKAFCEKNRYSGEDLTYLVFERRLKQLEITA